MIQGRVQHTVRYLGILVLTVLLTGCQVELYSGLSEKEGNDMLAILLDGGISAEKLLNKEKMVTLMVPSDDVSRSIKLLKSFGYPKEKYSSIGDIFPKDGLISSPTEERARYTYSMSQELSSTLSMIDGVITARVHVVLPQEQDSLSDVNYPSSASVFIKYTPELELAGFIPKVKTLVSNSIEGLSLEKITVSLFPATRINQGGGVTQKYESVFFVKVSPGSSGTLQVIVYGMFFLVLLAISGCGAMYWLTYMKKGKKKLRKAE